MESCDQTFRLFKILGLDNHENEDKIMEFPMKEIACGITYPDSSHPDYKKAIQSRVDAKYWDSGRFRSIYVTKRQRRIILLTRMGGWNREHYQYIFDVLRRHPNYIKDFDCIFDWTYAEIHFRVPTEYKNEVAQMVKEKKDCGKQFLAKHKRQDDPKPFETQSLRISKTFDKTMEEK